MRNVTFAIACAKADLSSLDRFPREMINACESKYEILDGLVKLKCQISQPNFKPRMHPALMIANCGLVVIYMCDFIAIFGLSCTIMPTRTIALIVVNGCYVASVLHLFTMIVLYEIAIDVVWCLACACKKPVKFTI